MHRTGLTNWPDPSSLLVQRAHTLMFITNITQFYVLKKKWYKRIVCRIISLKMLKYVYVQPAVTTVDFHYTLLLFKCKRKNVLYTILRIILNFYFSFLETPAIRIIYKTNIYYIYIYFIKIWTREFSVNIINLKYYEYGVLREGKRISPGPFFI